MYPRDIVLFEDHVDRVDLHLRGALSIDGGVSSYRFLCLLETGPRRQ